MRRRTLIAAGLLVLVPVGAVEADHLGPQKFRAHLTGVEEGRETRAVGNAIFRLEENHDTEAPDDVLHFRLVVSNMENVVAADLHLGRAGESGPVAAFLYGGPDRPVAPGGGPQSGILAEGAIRETDLPIPDEPGSDEISFAGLIDSMRSGKAYVEVHSDDGADPPNTGAGDFVDGEIRGQAYPSDSPQLARSPEPR